ncbi:putative protein TPRXL [Penaeus japonicus]|uniref:putative protein TPRXL n=1 Tax=Penaeus japonicus TaxID=27405 RepID=UPI001C70D9BC|nr:putative protein TPRXL [Penaeus japonicus]
MRLSPLSHHQDAVAVTARDTPRDLSTSASSITNSASTSFSSNTSSSASPCKAEDQHHNHHHTSSTTTFEDHIVIKEFVPSNLAAAAVSYKGVSAAVSTTLKSATTSPSLVKSVGDLSLSKASVATPLTKTLNVSTNSASPPQAVVPRGSPPPPMSHALLSVTATPSPATAAIQRAERTLALDTTSQKDIKALENGKMRNDSEEVSS